MLHQFKSLAHGNDHTQKFSNFIEKYFSDDNTSYYMFTEQQLSDMTNHPHFMQVFQDYLDDRKYLEQTRYPNRYDQSIWYDFYASTYGQQVSPEVEITSSIESCIRHRMKLLFDNKKNLYFLFEKMYEECLNTPEKLDHFRNVGKAEQVKLFKQFYTQSFAPLIAFQKRVYAQSGKAVPSVSPHVEESFTSEIGKQLLAAIIGNVKLVEIINQFTAALAKALVNSLSQNAVNQFRAQNEATKAAFLNAFKERAEKTPQQDSKGRFRP